MKMNGDFTNLKLSTSSNFYMEHSIIFWAIAVSVVVNVVARDRDVVDVQCSIFGEATDDRFGNSFVECSWTLNIYIFVTVIHSDTEVGKFGICTKAYYLFIFVLLLLNV